MLIIFLSVIRAIDEEAVSAADDGVFPCIVRVFWDNSVVYPLEKDGDVILVAVNSTASRRSIVVKTPDGSRVRIVIPSGEVLLKRL